MIRKIFIIVIFGFFLVLSLSFVKSYGIGGGFGIDLTVYNKTSNNTQENYTQNNYSEEDENQFMDEEEDSNYNNYYEWEKMEKGKKEEEENVEKKEMEKLILYSKTKKTNNPFIEILLSINFILLLSLILLLLKRGNFIMSK
jgi:hypothetical protein